MKIIGHGIDLVETERISRLLEEHGERFLARCFTESEQAYCDSGKRRRLEHYAARFAAKEAILKALGTGWRNGIAWTDMEILREPSGQPKVLLSGRCAQVAGEKGITAWWISLSHTDTHAMASAIAVEL